MQLLQKYRNKEITAWLERWGKKREGEGWRDRDIKIDIERRGRERTLGQNAEKIYVMYVCMYV